MTSTLDLVRERIAARLAEARNCPMLGHLGVWLCVLEDVPSWSAPTGLLRYDGVAEAAAVYAAYRSEGARQYLADGLVWLQERRFFVHGRPKGLEADPWACVALAAGIAAIGVEDAKQWLGELVKKAVVQESDASRLELFRLAAAVVNDDEQSWAALSPLVAVACSDKLRRYATPEQRKAAVEVVLSPDGPDVEWALLHEAALQRLFAMEAAIDLAHPSIQQVGDLLRRIPAALKRWPWEDKAKTKHRNVTAQRWDIQHEYHVQSLVWAVLRPVFPGLEDEENLPSIAHKHPRADLLVPSLRLVVEVKYLREATQTARANLIEQVAADAALYRTEESQYDSIIAFIWDDTGSSHHHAELEQGIQKLTGIVDVVVVSRPGEWRREL